jgi:hypothetical protein
MDPEVGEQLLEELVPALEALETRSTAMVQFLKDKGIATDEQLAPYLQQAASASSVRWRAIRLRIARLLSLAEKAVEQNAEQAGPEKPEKTEAGTEKGKAAPETRDKKPENSNVAGKEQAGERQQEEGKRDQKSAEDVR